MININICKHYKTDINTWKKISWDVDPLVEYIKVKTHKLVMLLQLKVRNYVNLSYGYELVR